MSEPLVSIITPTYGHARFIQTCLRSVQRQTYSRWELIVVDDASTDETPKIVRSFASRDRRIEVIAHTRRYGPEGLADTYNEALEASRGELVAVLEGDDWWARDKLARQVHLLSADPSVVLSYGDCWEVTEDGRPIGHVSARISPRSVRSSTGEVLAHLAVGTVPASTVLVRRDALERTGGFLSAGLPVVDYPTWLTMTLQGEFIRVPAPIGYWRRHVGSVYWHNMRRIMTGCHDVFLGFVERNEPAIREAGLDPGCLVHLADRALDWKLSSLPYFDAKHELLFGDRSRALRKLLRVVASPETSIRHRLAGLVGIGAGLSSPDLFSLALAARRSLRRIRSTEVEAFVPWGGGRS